MEYQGRWTLQVDAENATEAAELAAEAGRDPTGTATVFEVCEEEEADDPLADWITVDVGHDGESEGVMMARLLPSIVGYTVLMLAVYLAACTVAAYVNTITNAMFPS